jgi:threonine aldolase
LKEDHANARILAESISSIAGVHVQRGNVETNMVIIDLDLNAEAVVAAARAEGLALSPWGVTQLRAVTHLDVSTQDMHDASDVLARVLKELRKGHGL